jgi:hypothetical protein
MINFLNNFYQRFYSRQLPGECRYLSAMLHRDLGSYPDSAMTSLLGKNKQQFHRKMIACPSIFFI